MKYISEACVHCPLNLMCSMKGRQGRVRTLCWCDTCRGWVLRDANLIVACSRLGVPTYRDWRNGLEGRINCPNCRVGSAKYGAYTIVRPWSVRMKKLIFANALGETT